eukprot:844448-Rhodomonas_salina.2
MSRFSAAAERKALKRLMERRLCNHSGCKWIFIPDLSMRLRLFLPPTIPPNHGTLPEQFLLPTSQLLTSVIDSSVFSHTQHLAGRGFEVQHLRRAEAHSHREPFLPSLSRPSTLLSELTLRETGREGGREGGPWEGGKEGRNVRREEEGEAGRQGPKQAGLVGQTVSLQEGGREGQTRAGERVGTQESQKEKRKTIDKAAHPSV